MRIRSTFEEAKAAALASAAKWRDYWSVDESLGSEPKTYIMRVIDVASPLGYQEIYRCRVPLDGRKEEVDFRVPVIASWALALNCDCPACKQYVDLLTHPDFWDGRQLEMWEHSTTRSQDIDVVCPLCGTDFKSTLEL